MAAAHDRGRPGHRPRLRRGRAARPDRRRASTASSTAPACPADLIDAMVANGVALVPTVMQLDNFPEYADAGREQVPGVRRPHDAAATRPAAR